MALLADHPHGDTAVSHRFRETNAVGTTVFRAAESPCRCRIATERPTLLALDIELPRERHLHVASLPRDQRCWHFANSEIASALPTSHRFRETNAVGTTCAGRARTCARVASLPRDQRCWHHSIARPSMPRASRIASERPTPLALVVVKCDLPPVLSRILIKRNKPEQNIPIYRTSAFTSCKQR